MTRNLLILFYFFNAFFALSARALTFEVTVSAAACIEESSFFIVVSATAFRVSLADLMAESALLTDGFESLQEMISIESAKKANDFFIENFFEG